MNIGYSFWGYLGDYKFDENGNEVSTPDGNAFYGWSIIRALQKIGNEVTLLMPDRDSIGFEMMGNNLFGSWCKDARSEAYRKTDISFYNTSNKLDIALGLSRTLSKIDLILLEWRFKIQGRNYGEGKSQPDWDIQDRILKMAKTRSIPVIVFDLDYKLTVEDIAEYGIKSVIELGEKWNGENCRRVEIPFDFDFINEFDVLENTDGVVYVGNRYERDKSVDKYLAGIKGCTVYGNWKEAGRESDKRWKNIDFKDRIAARDMRNAYKDKNVTVLLAKDSYYKYGFMTARLIESVFYGVIPLFPEEFGKEVIEKYAGKFASHLTVRSETDVIIKNSALAPFKKEIVEYLREHLKFMDSKVFAEEVIEIYERMKRNEEV